jgi:hypothetical protein
VARVLIVEGAQRGLRLARELVDEGHAVRIVASAPERRGEVEAAGAECLVGTPNRLATMQGVLEHVTVACWLLADGGEDPEIVRALHGPRLEQFMSSAIDSTVRGLLYEAGGEAVPPEVLAAGERIVLETAERNSIPAAVLQADPTRLEDWLAEARAAIEGLLEGPRVGAQARYAGHHIPESRSAFSSEASTEEDS